MKRIWVLKARSWVRKPSAAEPFQEVVDIVSPIVKMG